MQFPVWAEIWQLTFWNSALVSFLRKPFQPFQDQILHSHTCHWGWQLLWPVQVLTSLSLAKPGDCRLQRLPRQRLGQRSDSPGGFFSEVSSCPALPCSLCSPLFLLEVPSEKAGLSPRGTNTEPSMGGDHHPRLLPQRPILVPMSVLPYLYPK